MGGKKEREGGKKIQVTLAPIRRGRQKGEKGSDRFSTRSFEGFMGGKNVRGEEGGEYIS